MTQRGHGDSRVVSLNEPNLNRIGVLMGFAENDSRSHAHMAAFRDGLQKLGWTESRRNIRIDTRWAAFDAESRQRFAKELITLGPGADHGRMARIAEAWDRSTAPGATSRSTISSASVRLQRLRLACRSGVQLIPILVMAGPVLAMHVFGQIYSIHFERGPPCQKKRSRSRNRKPN
jgi:hypothetical protein